MDREFIPCRFNKSSQAVQRFASRIRHAANGLTSLLNLPREGGLNLFENSGFQEALREHFTGLLLRCQEVHLGSPLLIGEGVQPEQDRQGVLSGRQIGSKGLPGLGFAAEYIGGIVINLVGNAEVSGKRAGRLLLGGFKAAEETTEVGGGREKLSRFQVDHPVISLQIRNLLPAGKGLCNFA